MASLKNSDKNILTVNARMKDGS